MPQRSHARRSQPRRNHGFTLIEALIAMAVTAILFGIAIPAFGSVTAAAHASSAQSALLASLTESISHAAITGSEVVLCPGDANGCRSSTDWSGGWIAYADIDGNRARGPNETLLHAQGPLAGRTHLRTTIGRKRLVFQPNGGNVGSNVTFTLCDARGPAKAVTLVLANNGRLRAGKPTEAAAVSCVSAL